jgi:hypothetical protein
MGVHVAHFAVSGSAFWEQPLLALVELSQEELRADLAPYDSVELAKLAQALTATAGLVRATAATCWLCDRPSERLFDFRGLGCCEQCWTELAWIASGKPEPGRVVPCPC